jgi:Ca-activated chloride channel family protein
MSMAGMFAKEGGAIPLIGVEVTGEVLGAWAEVRVRQRYRNVEPRPVEAVYTFPLPSQATLIGFAMTCEGRRIDGVVREREEAFRAYDDALVAGNGAALLEQERRNVFTASVGNLLPGEETVVEVTYLERVAADEGALRLSIPTLVAPRYIPGAPSPSVDRTADGWADPTDRVPDADRITPRVAAAVGYGLTLDLAFDLGRAVRVESPSHAIDVHVEGARVRVAFRQREVALDRDVVLIARDADEQPLTSVVTHRPATGDGFFALTVVPDLAGLERTVERQHVVFAIDVSGSMAGASLAEAQAALRLCLRHLREGDRFNIIAFASGHHAFAREPVSFTQRTLEQADRWVAALVADGGTELLAPLIAAVRQAGDGVVVLLTDGQVGNEEEILTAALAARGAARVYSFGIGTNVSDLLLHDLAQRTGGAVELIHPGERIDEKVVAQFARAIAPRVSDLTVTFRGVGAVELAPAALPAIVDGEPWRLLGRIGEGGVGEAELRGTCRGRPFRLAVPLDFGAHVERPVVAKLWASERIRDLEHVGVTGRRKAAMKDRIVALAVQHAVSSSFTAFIAVETRSGDRRTAGTPETRVIPVNLPAGWDMFRSERHVAAPPQQVARAAVAFGGMSGAGGPPAAAASAPRAKKARGAGLLSGIASKMADLVSAAHEPAAGYNAKTEATVERPADPVHALLARQLASGLWDEADTIADDEVRRARATARALLDLLDAGVNTAHPLHGAQVKKAIEALLSIVADVAAREPKVAELALGVAWLVASGHRTRQRVESAVAATAAIAGMRVWLSDEHALRARLEQLSAP